DEQTAAAAEKTETERGREQTHATLYRVQGSGFGVRGSRSARDIAASRADAVVVVFDLDADRMPAPVFRAGGLIAQIVLLAQLVGTPGGGGSGGGSRRG